MSVDGMISPRSRRLRTVGLVLLVAALCMALYGALVLMPSLRQVAADVPPAPARSSVSGATSGGLATSDAVRATHRANRLRRAAVVKATFLYAYWMVCGLLVLGAVFMAWLDFREVSRQFQAAQRSLLTEAIRATPPDNPN